MDDELAAFIKGRPPGRTRKLKPYAELVLGCHDLGWTCRAIADQLRRKKRLSVAPSTVWEFIRQHRPETGTPIGGAAQRRPDSVNVSAPLSPAASQDLPPAPAPQPAKPFPPTTKALPRKPRFNLDT